MIQSDDVIGDFSNITVLAAPADFDAEVLVVNGNVVLTMTGVEDCLLGDVNQNGVVDFLDIASFIEILTSSSFLKETDCNQDNMVNFLDISASISILSQ